MTSHRNDLVDGQSGYLIRSQANVLPRLRVIRKTAGIVLPHLALLLLLRLILADWRARIKALLAALLRRVLLSLHLPIGPRLTTTTKRILIPFKVENLLIAVFTVKAFLVRQHRIIPVHWYHVNQ